MNSIILTKPDDWHLHLRDQDLLKDTVAASAATFARALVMPNLKPALTTFSSLLAYRERILSHLPVGSHFTPYMTLYLNEQVDPADFEIALRHPFILGAKLYPAGVTTHSAEGAQSIRSLYPLFDQLQTAHKVLQIHGETLIHDIFEREAFFIQEELISICQNFPKLRIVLEHISTQDAVDFIMQSKHPIAATITPHHLKYNRNHLLSGGIRPHYYCLPILKHRRDQEALIKAIASGDRRFFAGTDSAPHPIAHKETDCGCAGIFSAPYAVALYAECFETAQCLQNLEFFMAHSGANFYELPYNNTTLELRKIPQVVPLKQSLGANSVVPIAAGETLAWSVYDR